MEFAGLEKKTICTTDSSNESDDPAIAKIRQLPTESSSDCNNQEMLILPRQHPPAPEEVNGHSPIPISIEEQLPNGPMENGEEGRFRFRCAHCPVLFG